MRTVGDSPDQTGLLVPTAEKLGGDPRVVGSGEHQVPASGRVGRRMETRSWEPGPPRKTRVGTLQTEESPYGGRHPTLVPQQSHCGVGHSQLSLCPLVCAWNVCLVTEAIIPKKMGKKETFVCKDKQSENSDSRHNKTRQKQNSQKS